MKLCANCNKNLISENHMGFCSECFSKCKETKIDPTWEKTMDLLFELENIISSFCVACSKDTMPHKEFLKFWHDEFAVNGYKIINKLYDLVGKEEVNEN